MATSCSATLKHQNNNHGMTLIIALVMLVVVMVLASSGLRMIITGQSETKQQQNVVAEANNIARAGITDAVLWFRHQADLNQMLSSTDTVVCPDALFYPQQAKGDTIDENIGMVKEIRLSQTSPRFARYEVWRQTIPYTSQSDAAYNPFAVHDITDQRMNGTRSISGDGNVWKITSKGIVYICHDATKRYDEPPNQVLAHTTLSKEIFRMVPLDPGAAIATNSFINVSTEAINPGAGCMLAFCENQSSQFWANQIRAYGNHGITTKGCEAITIPNYFGVSTDDLKSLADIAVNNVDSLPQPLPPMQFIFIDGQATFTASHPLNGSGLLVVNGDLNIEGSFTSTFSGYIFATNSVCIKNTNFRGNGCIISNDVVFSPPYNGSNPMPTIRYDQDLIRAVQQNISRFRESSFQRNEFTGFSER